MADSLSHMNNQDKEIEKLRQELEKSEDLLPWWAWVLIGAGIGGILVK